MQALLIAVITPGEAFVWIVLGFFGALGLLALVSPRRFSSVATRGGQWVDTNKVLEQLDKWVDIDAYVLPFSRLLGVAVLAAVALIAYLIVEY